MAATPPVADPVRLWDALDPHIWLAAARAARAAAVTGVDQPAAVLAAQLGLDGPRVVNGLRKHWRDLVEDDGPEAAARIRRAQALGDLAAQLELPGTGRVHVWESGPRNFTAAVRSTDGRRTYTVTWPAPGLTNRWSCDCAARRPCKHIADCQAVWNPASAGES